MQCHRALAICFADLSVLWFVVFAGLVGERPAVRTRPLLYEKHLAPDWHAALPIQLDGQHDEVFYFHSSVLQFNIQLRCFSFSFLFFVSFLAVVLVVCNLKDFDPSSCSFRRLQFMLVLCCETIQRLNSNNAAALLMPDNDTLVQFQPLVRCQPGGPLLSLSPYPQNFSILGDGTWGAHGGSLLR